MRCHYTGYFCWATHLFFVKDQLSASLHVLIMADRPRRSLPLVDYKKMLDVKLPRLGRVKHSESQDLFPVHVVDEDTVSSNKRYEFTM